MKKVIGVIFILFGFLCGAYLGGWLCFIGGIVQVIEAIRAVTLVPINVALGIAKVIFAGVVFVLTAMCFIIPGFKVLTSDRPAAWQESWLKKKL